ncbi:MAG: metal ABC transporter substrate-binding protein [Acidobacteriota bacterium]|nr:metal ABC transporter substrate-binding protein [Acidobacteriota bacterium]
MRTSRSILTALLILLPCLAEAGGGLKVVATTPDFAALIHAIGGDGVSLKIMAKATEDPHFVDARPSHIVSLNRADLVVESGADLEAGWLPPLIEGSRNKELLPGGAGRVLGSAGVRLLDVPEVLDRSRGDIHAQGNPHFLMDPLNAGIVTRRLTEHMCRLDPASCPSFRENLSRFERTLDERMLRWTAALAPHRGASIVTYHNTWRYFAARFELVADTFLEPKPGIPPSPPHLASVIGRMKQTGMRVILVEPFQSRRTAEKVARHTGATVVDVCQFPGGLEGTELDYFALMDANVSAIARALGGAGPR